MSRVCKKAVSWNTDILTLTVCQHSVRNCTMKVDCIINTNVDRRHHKRLIFQNKPGMTDQCFINDLIDRFFIILTAFGKAFDFVRVGLWKLIHIHLKLVIEITAEGAKIAEEISICSQMVSAFSANFAVITLINFTLEASSSVIFNCHYF